MSEFNISTTLDGAMGDLQVPHKTEGMWHPADMNLWHGRVDTEEGLAGRRWHQVIQPWVAQSDGVALIGFACDAGVARNHGRTGAAQAPATLRRALANLPIRGCDRLIDAGDVVCVGDALESAQENLSEALAKLLGQGLFPITLGGGHEVAVGSFGGLARYLADRIDLSKTTSALAPRIGILNLDAHFDLRLSEKGSSGTPFKQISDVCHQRNWPFLYCCLGVSDYSNTDALFRRAESLKATWLRDEEMGATGLSQTLDLVGDFLSGVDHLYLTIDLDVLPAAVAPGVSAPAAGGVALEVVEAIVDLVGSTGKLRLADIAEFNPRFDIDGHTARVAARLVGRLVESATKQR